jgi:hypothetical protein
MSQRAFPHWIAGCVVSTATQKSSGRESSILLCWELNSDNLAVLITIIFTYVTTVG